MKFAFYTLGCKVNQYETQAMQQMLLADGHTLGEFDELCDGYIINTCTVTAVSDKKSRNAIRRVRRLNPNAVVGVCGCYAQANPDEIRKLDVDVLVGSDGKISAAHALGAAGAVAGTANLITDVVVNLWRALEAGDAAEAERLQAEIEPIRDVLHLGSTPQTLKRSLELVGYEVGPARFPVTEVADGIDEKCIAMLDHYGIAHK